MRTTGLAVLSLTLLGILLLAFPATSEELAPRAIQPVQLGPTRDAADELPYAPGRIRVKFTEEAYRASILSAVEMRRGALAARAATGLPNTDAIAADVGVTGIVRQHTMPKDRDLATELGVDRWFVLHFARDVDVLAVVERLSADPSVEHALPDWKLYPALVPNDPYYPDHWGHNNTAQLLSYNWSTGRHEDGDPVGTPGFDCNAPAAWDALGGYGTSTVVVAVLDSGVDIDHPDLSLVAGYDFGDDDSNPDDNSAAPGHGTACSGVACSVADNSKGSAGSAGNCKIMPVKLANSAGSMYVTTLPPAIYFAADNGADVISMSFGNYLTSDPGTDDALLYAYNHGVTIVGATGNDNNTRVHYPAYNQYVIAVGAASPCGERKRSSSLSWECNPGVYTDPNGYTCDGERWWGSNYGPNSQDDATAVDVIAPTIVPTTDIGGGGGYDPTDYYKWFNGTSAATPYAAGVCALIISKYPSYTPSQVRDRLCTTAEDVVSVESGAGWDRYAGYGMVDAEAAVGGEQPPVADFAGDPTSGDTPLTVDFTDTSTGSPMSWSWDFGDGVGTSTEQNPTYTYDDPGTYTVSLTATNAYGSDTETKTDYITVTPPYPVADFVGDPTEGEPPLTVDFTDLTTNDPTSWAWDFGDGVGTSTEQHPSYIYENAGTYTVTLTATNAYGSDAEEKIDYIVVSQGVRDYAYTETTTTGTKTGSYLDTQASDDVREGLTEILYTGHPRKRYSYLEHEWTFNVTGGTAVTFFLEAYRTSNTDGDDFLFEYSTDGALYNGLVSVASATEQVYSVPLPASTAGTVYVRVTDTNRSWGAVSLDGVYVDEMYIESDTEPQPPVADFVGDPTYGYVPLTVQFTDMSTGAPTSWLWDFGDGVGTSTEQNPSYTYTAAGVYTVSLTAMNPEGSDTETKPDYITVEDQPSNTLHVSDIVVSRTYDGRFYRGQALVTILDEDDIPVAGVEVSGTFNAPSTKVKTGTTNGSGVATITSDKTKSPPSDWCFTVGNASLTGYTYDPAANLVTTACESGWQAGDFVPAAAGLTEPGLRFNRPNPFRETTEIVFVLPHASHVLLEVYSVAGRKVALLADRVMTVGPHAVRWDASEQPSGVYFCRLAAAELVESKAMVIIR